MVRLSRSLRQTCGFRISKQFIQFCFLFVFIFIVNIRYSQCFNNMFMSVKPVTLAEGHNDATDTCLALDQEVIFKFFSVRSDEEPWLNKVPRAQYF